MKGLSKCRYDETFAGEDEITQTRRHLSILDRKFMSKCNAPQKEETSYS